MYIFLKPVTDQVIQHVPQVGPRAVRLGLVEILQADEVVEDALVDVEILDNNVMHKIRQR